MAGPPLGSSALKAPAEFPWPYAHLSVEGFVVEVLEMGELHTHTRMRHACTCTHAHTHRRAHAPAALVPELQALGGPARSGEGLPHSPAAHGREDAAAAGASGRRPSQLVPCVMHRMRSKHAERGSQVWGGQRKGGHVPQAAWPQPAPVLSALARGAVVTGDGAGPGGVCTLASVGR